MTKQEKDRIEAELANLRAGYQAPVTGPKDQHERSQMAWRRMRRIVVKARG